MRRLQSKSNSVPARAEAGVSELRTDWRRNLPLVLGEKAIEIDRKPGWYCGLKASWIRWAKKERPGHNSMKASVKKWHQTEESNNIINLRLFIKQPKQVNNKYL
jgi:hypothetical protein